jgi:tetratricopeptide (TPR) repeat protein
VYALAQLNIALVYIRQDWWTDAQIAMQNAIKASGQKNIEFLNRVYTTLGFSQLQQGFYRNARESFRNVKIKSDYADQALLGLGMAALNQEDFLGAFNAFDQLKKHQKQNTFVEQSYLMSAFALAKLKQNKSAAAAYAEAETYYENRVTLLSAALTQLNNNDWQDFANLISQHNLKESPDALAFAKQLQILSKLLNYPISDKTKSAINNSYSQIFVAYQNDTKQTIDKKLAVLNSYLNQSRFGLTKLYDTP